MKRLYLWPIDSCPDHIICWPRARWVLWRWWTLEVRRWWGRRTCREHDPVTVRIGTLRDLAAKPEHGGHLQTRCARCRAVIHDFPPEVAA